MSNINTNEVRDILLEESKILKKYNIPASEVEKLLEEYHEAVQKVLLDYGYVQVSENLRLEIVKLQKRNHVLRGQSYPNCRRYKVKSKISYPFYEKIAESFASLMED